MKAILFQISFCFFALSIGTIVWAQAPSKECKNYQSHGNMQTMIEKWDLLLATADKNKSFNKDITEFKNKYGLLFRVLPPSNEMNGPPADRLVGEHPAGDTWLIFFKRLSGFKCCNFDSITEVKDLAGKKTVQVWSVPLEVTPAAIEGDELFFEYQLVGCTNESRGVVIAAKKDGSYRIVDKKLPPLNENKKVLGACTAPKKLFGADSDGVCTELQDLKTKQKRILVWQTPIT